MIAAAIPQFGTDKSIKWANSDANAFKDEPLCSSFLF